MGVAYVHEEEDINEEVDDVEVSIDVVHQEGHLVRQHDTYIEHQYDRDAVPYEPESRARQQHPPVQEPGEASLLPGLQHLLREGRRAG